jgi:pyruvate dehydrogenase E2 component (dihydrolipoamide acetyltransferase)
MATIVELPRLSDTMEEGVVASWRIAVGDKVKRGQVIAEIETDKATMEFESFDAGVVLSLVAGEGDALPVGAAIAVLGKQGEDPEGALRDHGGPAAAPAAEGSADVAAAKPAADAPAPAPAANSPAQSPKTAPADRAADARVPASPVARKLAREAGIPLHAIPGSGPHGRVIKADVEAAAANPGQRRAGVVQGDADEDGRPYVSRPDTVIAHSLMRKTIAKRMTQAKVEAPHFYLTVDIDMQEAAKVRASYNEAIEGKVSFNDLVIMAVARSLRQHPEVNAHYTPDGIVQVGDIHVGVAVAVEGGLVVPVVRHAEQRTLESIAKEVRALAGKARGKTLMPAEMSGSTISVSNLGMFGVESFSAVINPGEGAILAIGAVEDRPVVVAGELVVRKRMKCTMSCDHRAIDGAVGAVWLQTFRDYLENPMRLFT